MRTAGDYQQQAIRCLRLAQTIDYPPSKAVWLDLAEQWAQRAREQEAEETPSICPIAQHPER